MVSFHSIADLPLPRRPNGLAFNLEGTKLYGTPPTATLSASHNRTDILLSAAVTDTGCINAHSAVGQFSVDSSRGGQIYEFPVIRPAAGTEYSLEGPTLGPRRLFAFSDGGAPDGIKTDTQGNVYSSTCDGVQVWNRHGTLIAKLATFPDQLPESYPSESEEHRARISANFCFLPKGRLFMMAEDRIYLAQLDESVKGSLLP